MEEIFRLIVYFIIYAFIGWILESTYKTILQKKIINSGFLSGPFCPIYGFGALIMYISLKDLTNNIIVLFLFGMIVLSLFEYVVGLFLEIVFKTKYWDYSSYKFNIHGRVCLKNSIYWGILGIIFMRVIHPMVENSVKDIPVIYIIITITIGIIYMLIDAIMTIIKLIKINTKLKNWENITYNIKNKIEAINFKTSIKFENISKLKLEYKYKTLKKLALAKKNEENILGELKLRQQEIQMKLEKRIEKMQKAFPTMNSERLSKFLNNSKKS